MSTTTTEGDSAALCAQMSYASMLLWQKVDACDKAIKQYAEMGISGTRHDLEHRQMRAEALAALEKLR